MSYVKTSVSYRRRSRRSRVRKGRVLGFALAVMLATLAAWLWYDDRSGAHSRGIAPANAAKLAPPSLQAPKWTNSQRLALAAGLRGAFEPALSGATGWSLVVLDAGGRMLYGDRFDRAVAPASVQKLIVASSALDALGPQFRYHTLFAAQAPPEDGVLSGDLWLAGSGDPSLQSSDVRNGVAILSRSGLRRIGGGVVIDATALRGPSFNRYWSAQDDGQAYATPTSAISLRDDTLPANQSRDVARYVATQTQTILAARGIRPQRNAGLGATPLDSVVLWDHKSAPLQALEAHMLFASDNHYAEQLLRTIGAEVTGQSDDEGGIAAERLFLRRSGIPVPGLRLFDGSGLSESNRLASITVARLLLAREPSLYRLLPLGGREGTLADYDFTAASGRVRAKSGHLSDVSSLAGYANTTHHGRVAFAFLIDGSPGDPDASIVRAVNRLVGY
jgi:serine-type D-Ala-D-Ala carboxypeptidase/endopeptidase (penicillin-binding protein 4)